MSKYRKKPVVIEAIQWTGDNVGEIGVFCGHEFHGGQVLDAKWPDGHPDHELYIGTLEDGRDGIAKHVASVGDWIVRGVEGEFYPVKPDIFAATYEPVE